MIAPRDSIAELKPDQAEWTGLLVLCSALAAGGVFIVRDGKMVSAVVGCFGTLFGLAGIVAAIAALFSKRMALRLTSEGFSYGTLRKKYFYKWSDIGVFGVGSIGEKKACFTLRADYVGEEKLRAVNRGSIGFDRFLPDTYGKKPMELAKLLEEWRHSYSET